MERTKQLEGDVWRDVYMENTNPLEASCENNHTNNKNLESTSNNDDKNIASNDMFFMLSRGR